jgi:hypothetical protein
MGDNVAMLADVCLCGGTAHDVAIGLPSCTVYNHVSITIHGFTILHVPLVAIIHANIVLKYFTPSLKNEYM